MLPSAATASSVALPSGLAGLAGAGAAAGAAAPSVLQTLLKGAGPLADILGSASANAQRNNQITDSQNLTRDQVQQKANEDATNLPASRLRDSLKASLLNNFTPTTVQWGGPGSGLSGQIPTFSGGMKAGLQNLDPGTKQLSQQVIQDELMNQLRGGASGGNQDDTVPPIGQSSTGDDILGGSAGALGILAALQKSGLLGSL